MATAARVPLWDLSQVNLFFSFYLPYLSTVHITRQNFSYLFLNTYHFLLCRSRKLHFFFSLPEVHECLAWLNFSLLFVKIKFGSLNLLVFVILILAVVTSFNRLWDWIHCRPCNIVVSVFEFKLHYYVHFRTHSWERYEPVEKRKISYFGLALNLIRRSISPNQDDLSYSARTFISG